MKNLKMFTKALELDPDNEYLISGVSDAFFNVVNEEEKHEIVSYFLILCKNPFHQRLGVIWELLIMKSIFMKAIESFDYALALDEKRRSTPL